MVTIGMNYRVREGKEKVFEDAFRSVLGALDGADGHAESQLFRSVGDDARTYLIVSRWESEKAFHEFVRSDSFRKVTNWGTQNILDGPPRHTTYLEAPDS